MRKDGPLHPDRLSAIQTLIRASKKREFNRIHLSDGGSESSVEEERMY